MKRMVTVCVAAGGILIASSGAALGKTTVGLSVNRSHIRPGQVVTFHGDAGSDDRHTPRDLRLCLQERRPGHEYVRLGPCVTGHRVDGTQSFVRRIPLRDPGVYTFRAIVLDRAGHPWTAPSEARHITVRA